MKFKNHETLMKCQNISKIVKIIHKMLQKVTNKNQIIGKIVPQNIHEVKTYFRTKKYS